MAIREIRRSALVTFSPEQMFDLVIDVERYPEFLPWVAGARLHETSPMRITVASFDFMVVVCSDVERVISIALG